MTRDKRPWDGACGSAMTFALLRPSSVGGGGSHNRPGVSRRPGRDKRLAGVPLDFGRPRPARAWAELRARTARQAWRALLWALVLVRTVLAPPKKGARQVPWGCGGGGGHPGLTAGIERARRSPPKTRGAPTADLV